MQHGYRAGYAALPNGAGLDAVKMVNSSEPIDFGKAVEHLEASADYLESRARARHARVTGEESAA